MKTIFAPIAISVATLFLSLSSFAAFDGAEVDLKKFVASAQAAFRSQGLPESVSEVYFRDAAFATDTHMLFDGAMLYVLGEKAPVSDSFGSYAYGYRFMPSTGNSELLLIQIGSKNSRMIIPEAVMIRLGRDISPDDFRQAYERIVSQLDASKYQVAVFKNLKHIAIDIKKPSIVSLIEVLNLAKKFGGAVSLSSEKYRTEFEFGPPQRLPTEGIVDLDKLRDVVPKYLIERNLPFKTTQSKLPTYLCAAIF